MHLSWRAVSTAACAHSSSPKDANGNYLFEPGWRYLYGVPVK
jgi:hypothetical protein